MYAQHHPRPFSSHQPSAIEYDSNTRSFCGNMAEHLGQISKPWQSLYVNHILNNSSITICQGVLPSNNHNLYSKETSPPFDDNNLGILLHADNTIQCKSENANIQLFSKYALQLKTNLCETICTEKIDRIENNYALKSQSFNINTGVTNLKSFNGITMEAGNGRISFITNHIQQNAFDIHVQRGGFNLNTGSTINLNSNNNINVSCSGSLNLLTNQSTNNPTTNNQKQTIQIGNQTTNTIINGTVILKGQLLVNEQSDIQKYVSKIREVPNVLHFKTSFAEHQDQDEFDFGWIGGKAGMFYKHTNGTFHLAKQMGNYNACYFEDPEIYGDLYLKYLHTNYKVDSPCVETNQLITTNIQSIHNQLYLKAPTVTVQNVLKATSLTCETIHLIDDAQLFGNQLTMKDIKTQTFSSVSGHLHTELVIGETFFVNKSFANHIGTTFNLQYIQQAIEDHMQNKNLKFILTDTYHGNENVTLDGIGLELYLTGCSCFAKKMYMQFGYETETDTKQSITIQSLQFDHSQFCFTGNCYGQYIFRNVMFNQCEFQFENPNADIVFDHCQLMIQKEDGVPFHVSCMHHLTMKYCDVQCKELTDNLEFEFHSNEFQCFACDFSKISNSGWLKEQRGMIGCWF